jgi:hypothetical protein
MKPNEKVVSSAIEPKENGVRVTKMVEYAETLTIEQVHGRLAAEEKNLELYQKIVAETQERIDQYRKILAEYYGKPTNQSNNKKELGT